MDLKQAAHTLHSHRNCKKLKSSSMTRPACKLVDWSLHTHLPFPISVSYEDTIVKLSAGGGGRKQVVGIVRKHMNFWELKGCAWQDQPASLQPDPDMHIYLFSIYQLQKIVSNCLWLQ